MFAQPDPTRDDADFKLKVVPPPERYGKYLEKVVLVERLREVRALVGFTRIASPGDYEDASEIPGNFGHRCRGRNHVGSRPRTSGVRDLPALQEEIWSRNGAAAWFATTLTSSTRTSGGGPRGLPDPDHGYPGLRFALLHSLAHALIRQLALECGYTAASIRERIIPVSLGRRWAIRWLGY